MSAPADTPALDSGLSAAELARRFREVRGFTERLAAPLSPEDCVVQSMTEASPVKWQLGHTTWFFETFVLEREIPGYRPVHPEYRVLFNSYYNAVGEQHPRDHRGMLTRPSLDEVMEYRRRVDEAVLGILDGPAAADGTIRTLVEIGIHHEQQHQELIVTDVKHLLSRSPLFPAYDALSAPAPGEAGTVRWVRFDEGLRTVGHRGPGFAFDNEGPAHRVFLTAFEIASRPVTVGEYLAFVEDGAYETPEIWLADAWGLIREQGWSAPLYWLRRDGGWREFTLGGLRELHPEAPMTHVSYYEADAYATWAGARLPTEHEWEVAAEDADPAAGNFVEDGVLHPIPVEAADGVAGLFGNGWEWTRSPYSPYPGFKPAAGALGEYNGKFMCNQMVLRGGSCATSRSHIRPTYRNFFFPDARWQFSAIRLARDVR